MASPIGGNPPPSSHPADKTTNSPPAREQAITDVGLRALQQTSSRTEPLITMETIDKTEREMETSWNYIQVMSVGTTAPGKIAQETHTSLKKLYNEVTGSLGQVSTLKYHQAYCVISLNHLMKMFISFLQQFISYDFTDHIKYFDKSIEKWRTEALNMSPEELQEIDKFTASMNTIASKHEKMTISQIQEEYKKALSNLKILAQMQHSLPRPGTTPS